MDAETLTAVAVIIAALTGLVTAVGIFIVRTRVAQVQVQTNSHQDRLEARITELTDTLREANVAVPDPPEREVL